MFVDMLKTRQCLLGIRTFLGVTSRIWGFIMYILRKHLRTVRLFEHDTCDFSTNYPAFLGVQQFPLCLASFQGAHLSASPDLPSLITVLYFLIVTNIPISSSGVI